ncbi:MAG: hypothetical protein KBF57_11550, partial [Saprospiraceae bacterium]|nr:hypothetical protein [Saprospiraceae bacterium]
MSKINIAKLILGFVFITINTSHLLAQGGRMWKDLIWSDEFDGTGLPDSSKWTYDVGNGCPQVCGWGNNELQYYT